MNIPWLKEQLVSVESFGQCVIGKFEDAIGFLVIENAGVDGLAEDCVDQIGELMNGPGLLIDLRLMQNKNTNQRQEEYQHWLKEFFEVVSRSANGNMPIACLIGPGCDGTGADLAGLLKSLPGITFIGQPSGQFSSEMTDLSLSYGIMVHYPTRNLLAEDIEASRVDPDYIIDPIPGIDSVTSKALELIRMSGEL